MTTLTNYYSLAFNNLVFGAGTVYPVLSIDGLESLPELRVQDDNAGYNDGMFTGRDFLSGRTLTMEILTFAGNGLSAQQNFDLLQAALVPQQQGTSVLQFQLSATDTPKRINARVRKRVSKIDPEYTYGFIRAVYQFFSPEPWYFDETQQSGSMSPTTVGGRTYNRTYNLTYPASSQTNTVNVTNAGWATVYPTITINGPVTNPVIGNSLTGQTVGFNYTLSSTDVLVVNLQQRLVTLNGNPARNLVVNSSSWFSCGAGSTPIYFTGSGTTVGVTAALVTWRNAYV